MGNTGYSTDLLDNQDTNINLNSKSRVGIVRHQITKDNELKIIRFFPIQGQYYRKLTPIERIFSSTTIQGGVIFQGKICSEKFILSMEETLNYFDFLLCRFDYEGEALCVKFSGDVSGKSTFFTQLEIEEKKGIKKCTNIQETLPQKIDNRLKTRICLSSLKGMPLASFKLTTWDDSFVIGFVFNHCFLDFSSFSYFMKFLSTSYTKGDVTLLKKPFIFDGNIPSLPKLSFSSLSDFRLFGEQIGYKHLDFQSVLRNLWLYGWDIIDQPRILTHLYLNRDEIKKITQSSSCHLSENDVIHGIFLKIYSMNPHHSPDKSFNLGYFRNMRGKLNLGEEALGNVLNFSKIQSHIGEIKNLSVLKLSELNRSKISATLLQEAEQYKQFLSWVKQEANFSQSVSIYLPSLYFDMISLASILSNVANAFNVGDIAINK